MAPERLLLALVFLAAFVSLGGRCGSAGPRRIPYLMVTLNTIDLRTDQEMVDVHQTSSAYLHTRTRNVRPIGHPDLSNADCVATPDSVGCRIADVHDLAAQQGAVADRLCMTYRADIYRKYPGYPIDSINGVTFDSDWLIRMPGDEYEADAAQWPNGIVYDANRIDQTWVESEEDPCCHDATPDNCTASDLCVARYGNGDDVTQQFRVNALVADLRSPDYQQWSAERFVAKHEDVGADCSLVDYKRIYFEFRSGGDPGIECWRPDGDAWMGPASSSGACAKGPLSHTPYAAGEYEAAMDGAMQHLLDELEVSGYPEVGLITEERPIELNERWTWMSPSVRSNRQIVGDFVHNVDPF